MILTGKALEDFTQWNSNKQFDMMLPFEYPTYLNALIIEWLDSVGVYIEIFNEFGDFGMSIHRGSYKNPIESIGHWKTRQEATEQAIIKANDIYNER